VAARYPQQAAELGVASSEVAAWLKAADAIVVPFDKELGVTSQSEDFTRYRRWDFSSMSPEDYPLLLHFPYYLLYSSQVVKQADLVLALYLCGDSFSTEQKRKDFDYYEAITVRDSSLSASTQAVVAAEVGHLDLACDYFRESALVDLRDLAGNTSDGLHLASLAGAWLVAVAGFGGLRDHGDLLSFAPRLPASLGGLSFRLMYRGRSIRVDLGRDSVRYQLLAGDELELLHYDDRVRLSSSAPEMRAVPTLIEPPPVSPPVGRAPLREGVGADAAGPGTAAPHRPPSQPVPDSAANPGPPTPPDPGAVLL
jgi:alpha,alpha-trehalose phosphorylase